MISRTAAPWVAIALASVVTYALRSGGLLLSEKLPRTGRVRIFLDALPGTLLVALVAPPLVGAGPVGMVAGAVVVALAVKTGNTFVAMGVGTALVAVLRAMGG